MNKQSQRIGDEVLYWMSPDANLIDVHPRSGHLHSIPAIAKQYHIDGFAQKDIFETGEGKFDEFLGLGFIRMFIRAGELAISLGKTPNSTQVEKLQEVASRIFRFNGSVYVSFPGSKYKIAKNSDELNSILENKPIREIAYAKKNDGVVFDRHALLKL